MLPTVSQTFGVPLVKGPMYGVEVELEGRNVPQVTKELALVGWLTKDDLSLKAGGIEFYFKGPQNLGLTEEAIRRLWKETAKFEPMYTNRTATHVHYNISDLTIDKMYDLFTINLMFEELLLSYVDEERRGNMFCLSASDADAVLYNLIKDKKDGTFKVSGMFDSYKYGNLNFAAACKYGTIEYRSLQTPKHDRVLLDWVQCIHKINEFVRDNNQPAAEYIRGASIAGPATFAKSVLGDHIKMFEANLVKDLMMRGIRNAQHVAFTELNREAILKIKPRPPRAQPNRNDPQPFMQAFIEPAPGQRVPQPVRAARGPQGEPQMRRGNQRVMWDRPAQAWVPMPEDPIRPPEEE